MIKPKNFVLNSDIYCALTFGWHREPDPKCDCEWEKKRMPIHTDIGPVKNAVENLALMSGTERATKRVV